MTRLEDIEERLNKATPAPWKPTFRFESAERARELGYDTCQDKYEHATIIRGPDSSPIVACATPQIGTFSAKGDIDFIAHSPEDIRYLLDEVKFLEAKLEDAGDALGEACAGADW